MRLVGWVTIATGALSSVGGATSPATVEQMVCSPASMFLGTVLSAKAVECRKRAGDECLPTHIAKLKIQVVQVLQGSSDGLSAGQVLDTNTNVCSAPPILIGKTWYQVCGLADRDVTVRRDNEPATDADVAKAFDGRTFWFARWQNGDVITYIRPQEALAMWRDVCPTSHYRIHLDGGFGPNGASSLMAGMGRKLPLADGRFTAILPFC
jgi:hypothetical protein